MAHLTDGTLRRMVDDPDASTGADSAHLDGCADCKARRDAIAEDARSIATLLSAPEVRVDVAAAYSRVMRAPQAQPALGLRLPLLHPVARPMKLAFVAAVAAAAVMLVAFAAGGFFFQPTKVQPVPITLSDLQALSQLGEYGTLTWTKEPNLQVTPSAADAASVSGLQPPTVSKLPTGVSSTVTYGAMSKAEATFTFSAAKAAAAAAASGKTLPKMPASMDGAGDTTPADINLPQLIVAKSVSPTVSSTQVEAKTLENYIVSLPGISDELKKTISAIGDGSTTLFIPVPVEYGTSKTVNVQGVEGVALGDNTGVGSAVVWVKDGHVYAVAGTIKQSDAIEIANNLK